MKKFLTSIIGFHLTIIVGLSILFYFNNLEDNLMTVIINLFLGMIFVSVLLSMGVFLLDKPKEKS
jgi:hypothetical protein